MVRNGMTASMPLERSNAMLSRRASAECGKDGTTEDFQRRAVFAKRPSGLLEDFRLHDQCF